MIRHKYEYIKTINTFVFQPALIQVSQQKELKDHGGEELQKRVIRKSGNGSFKALDLNKKVAVNLSHLPVRSQQGPLGCYLVTGRPLPVVTVPFPALCADAEAPREVDILSLPGMGYLIPYAPLAVPRGVEHISVMSVESTSGFSF